MADTFSWRISDQWNPTANSGFVYLLISIPQHEQMYDGTTENVAVSMTQHSRGYGAEVTACPDYLPWAVAAYMTNMAHLTRSERYSIEAQWQELNQRSLIQRRENLEQMIKNKANHFERAQQISCEHAGQGNNLCRAGSALFCT